MVQENKGLGASSLRADRATRQSPSPSVSALRASIASAVAFLSLLAADAADARCGGANGYCTRAAQERRERDEARRKCAVIRREQTELERHNHPTLARKNADHARLAEIEQSISWYCRHGEPR